jgi:GDP/UDP-N,N'-diacetylbacillosamine 2-epimerase (hydrolysing)
VTRRLTYLTGTRADFGLMQRVLEEIAAAPGLELELVVTGMHLSDRFGRTGREVEASGLPIARRIDVPVDEDSGRAMAVAAGLVTSGMADYFAERPRDGLLVLGDRGEMLAGAIAALYADVPIVHIAGGERSGSVDESIRHAISKLAHLHCVAVEDGRQRLLNMGEEPWRIHVTGTPGLAGLRELASVGREELAARYGFDPARPFALLLFHPVVQDAAEAGAQWRSIFAALAGGELQVLALLPNADHGTESIRAAIGESGLIPIDHMPRADYVSALRHADFLIGNSSSGIIEAATLGTAVVNVGDRQDGRLRSANVFDAGANPDSIAAAIGRARAFDGAGLVNVYGEPHADRRIRALLEETDLGDRRLRKKVMTY